MDMGFLAAMLVEDGGIKKAIEFGVTNEFFSGGYGKVFEFIVRHYRDYSKTPDVDTVERLTGLKIEPTKEPLDYWMKEVQNRYVYEQISGGFNGIVSALETKDGFKALELLDGLLHRAYRGSVSSSSRVENLIDLGEEVIAAYEEAKLGLTGIPTPWPSLDAVTMGWQPDDLVIFASRSGIGKSWTMLLLAYHAMLSKKKVLLVCTEMARKAVARRFFSVMTKMSYGHVRHGKLTFSQEPLFKQRVRDMMNGEFREYVKVVGEGFDFTIEALDAILIEEQPDLVLVDGAYLMKVKSLGSKDRFSQVSAIADEMKKLAKKHHKPFIASVQLNRKALGDGTKDGGKVEVGLQHLGLSDNLGWVADYVFFLIQELDDKNSKTIRLRSGKTRDSDSPGDIPLSWDFERMHFDELTSGVDYDRIKGVKKAAQKKERQDNAKKKSQSQHWTDKAYNYESDDDRDYENVPF